MNYLAIVLARLQVRMPSLLRVSIQKQCSWPMQKEDNVLSVYRANYENSRSAE